MTALKPYPTHVCFDCATAAGGKTPTGHTPAWCQQKCGVCEKTVCAARPYDFAFPEFEGHERRDTDIQQGTFKIIRVDGTEEVHQRQPSLVDIMALIGCDGLDLVTVDRWRETVMLMDDTGHLSMKPTNPKATALYLTICKPGTQHAIVGDVALVNHADFS